MSDPNDPCIFCKLPREVIAENKHAYASWDTYPVSEGHALVTPRRHVRTIWDMDEAEYGDCFLLVRAVKALLDERFKPDGYNVGANCETAGGQSIWHAHIHVIPRYTGDVENPRGGVRNVLPLKARYVRK